MLRFFASLSFASRPPLARFRYWRIPKPAPEIEAKVRNEISTFSTLSKKNKKKKYSNEFGNLRWVLALPWSGRYAFEDADFQDWGLDDDGEGRKNGAAPAGQVKGDGLALSFVRFVPFFSLSLFSSVARSLLPSLTSLSLSLSLLQKQNRVLGAGHMVPMDQPAAALKMITAFTRGEKIAAGGGKGGVAAVA